MSRIHGVVVLYNPDNNIIDNINSYLDCIDRLYLIDNSEKKSLEVEAFVRRNSKCEYICNGDNLGIAKALNIGAELAKKNNAKWLLTMDQDSRFEKDNCSLLCNYVNEKDDKQLGVVSPFHNTAVALRPIKEEEKRNTVMTSGNIISLYAHSKVKGFREELFIDCVDWDYCIRLNLMGFLVLRLNRIYLNHCLGDAIKVKTLFGKDKVLLKHNKIRMYYIVRNILQMIRDYWKYYPRMSLSYLKSILRIYKEVILYEKDGKLLKLRYMTKGVIDFLIGKLGKISEVSNK